LSDEDLEIFSIFCYDLLKIKIKIPPQQKIQIKERKEWIKVLTAISVSFTKCESKLEDKFDHSLKMLLDITN
jgi:hypothetical protein